MMVGKPNAARKAASVGKSKPNAAKKAASAGLSKSVVARKAASVGRSKNAVVRKAESVGRSSRSGTKTTGVAAAKAKSVVIAKVATVMQSVHVVAAKVSVVAAKASVAAAKANGVVVTVKSTVGPDSSVTLLPKIVPSSSNFVSSTCKPKWLRSFVTSWPKHNFWC